MATLIDVSLECRARGLGVLTDDIMQGRLEVGALGLSVTVTESGGFFYITDDKGTFPALPSPDRVAYAVYRMAVRYGQEQLSR